MQKKLFNWRLGKKENVKRVKKYCTHCKKTVLFTDSLKRRKNANGKNIYEFAIYKCENDHTWNKKLSRYKACVKDDNHMNEPMRTENNTPDPIDLRLLQKQGYDIIEINLLQVNGTWRLDMLLSENLTGISRAYVKKMIKNRQITLENRKTKSGLFIRTGTVISISLRTETVI